MTFVLVSVVYATAVTKPGHGSHAPLAIGFTLYASAAVGATSCLGRQETPEWHAIVCIMKIEHSDVHSLGRQTFVHHLRRTSLSIRGF